MEIKIADVAAYLQELLPQDIPESYSIKTMFTDISNDVDIRNGVHDFRNFLSHLFASLIENEDIADIPKRGKKKYSDETTLTVEFPFINNIRSILLNVGQHGVLSDDGASLLVDNWEILSSKRSLNKNSTSKISNAQMLKTLRFLTTCGIRFEGVDLELTKPDLARVENIEISYPSHPIMLIAWKAMGIAQNELSSRKNDDILLRCDYRALMNEERNIASMMKDYVTPLSAPIQDFIFEFHQHYIELGMKCEVELGFLCTHFMYSYKNKHLWRFSTSLHNGYRMVYKAKNTSKYTDVIEGFSKPIRETIDKGYGCDRKSGSGHGNCQNACEGFRFSLDESILDISKDLETWIDCELESMQKRSVVSKHIKILFL